MVGTGDIVVTEADAQRLSKPPLLVLDRVRAFLDGRQRDAAALVPDAFVDQVALVGPQERIRDRLDAWRESGATTMLVSTRDAASLRALADVAL